MKPEYIKAVAFHTLQSAGSSMESIDVKKHIDNVVSHFSIAQIKQPMSKATIALWAIVGFSAFLALLGIAFFILCYILGTQGAA